MNPIITGVLKRALDGLDVDAALRALGPLTDDVTNSVIRLGKGNADRGRFVRELADRCFVEAEGQYHVLVFHSAVDHEHNLETRMSFDTASYFGIPYRMYFIIGGTFVNKGDGGYINWAWRCPVGHDAVRSGRDGKTVTFPRLAG